MTAAPATLMTLEEAEALILELRPAAEAVIAGALRYAMWEGQSADLWVHRTGAVYEPRPLEPIAPPDGQVVPGWVYLGSTCPTLGLGCVVSAHLYPERVRLEGYAAGEADSEYAVTIEAVVQRVTDGERDLSVPTRVQFFPYTPGRSYAVIVPRSIERGEPIELFPGGVDIEAEGVAL